MRAHLLGCLLVLAGSASPLPPQASEASAAPAPDDPATQTAGDLRVEWAEDFAPLVIPRDETLRFDVRAGVGGLGATVGSVVMRSTVEPYRKSVLLMDGGTDGGARESGRLRIQAEGDYELFTLKATIETLVHPVRWPFLVSNFTRAGTKDRRKETVLGWKEDEPRVRYRRDTTRGAPEGTRIWKEPKERDLPVPALDMVAASYFSREMARDERLFMQFPVADKLDLWQITLRRGKSGRVETRAGTFDALQLVLEPAPYPGEVADEKVQEKAEEFRGLFGIHGSIHVWVHRATGVPVLISGELPVGPINLSISVVLKSYSGTPPAFRPVD